LQCVQILKSCNIIKLLVLLIEERVFYTHHTPSLDLPFDSFLLKKKKKSQNTLGVGKM
jgi:hypothetical protein